MQVTINIPVLPGTLEAALEALTAVDAAILDAYGDRLPMLYESGVRYAREPKGTENWRTVLGVLRAHRRGEGSDCEDLAAWRAAELRVYAAEPARAVALQMAPRQFHAVVLRADGTLEDPARVLRSPR